LQYRRRGLSRQKDIIFRAEAAPKFWRVNFCQEIAAYTRANAVYELKIFLLSSQEVNSTGTSMNIDICQVF
jgi:hypothetical protein